MIYLASPYTHENPAIRHMRYSEMLCITQKYMRDGYTVFSPIVYGHQFALVDDTRVSFEAWKAFNDHMLKASTLMHVICQEGWENSKGIRHEIGFAGQRQISICFINAEAAL